MPGGERLDIPIAAHGMEMKRTGAIRLRGAFKGMKKKSRRLRFLVPPPLDPDAGNKYHSGRHRWNERRFNSLGTPASLSSASMVLNRFARSAVRKKKKKSLKAMQRLLPSLFSLDPIDQALPA